ncbi:MAG: hypothetical protein AAGD22_12890 [Verrucomicrobiota bacterium]
MTFLKGIDLYAAHGLPLAICKRWPGIQGFRDDVGNLDPVDDSLPGDFVVSLGELENDSLGRDDGGHLEGQENVPKFNGGREVGILRSARGNGDLSAGVDLAGFPFTDNKREGGQRSGSGNMIQFYAWMVTRIFIKVRRCGTSLTY